MCEEERKVIDENKKRMITRRVVEDISFTRFVKELAYYSRKHPDSQIESADVGDDERAENAFMFRASMTYEKE